jgi:hypothetical protein
VSFDVHVLRVVSGKIVVFEHKTTRRRSNSFNHREEKGTEREAKN